ncbi:GAP family protein [Sandaracinobacter neustonicus]|nr:GAP family protein [Sandaracinobacter neustonicus]
MTLAAAMAPAALAIAASPFGIVPAILFLFTPRPKAGAAAFLGGWALGIAAGFLLAMLLGVWLEGWSPGPALAWAKRGLGLLLLALALRNLLTRNRPTEMPGWMRGIETASPAGAARLGLMLSLANPKVLLLALAAGAAALEAGLGLGSGLVLAAAGFAAAASLTVAAPLIAYALAGERALRPLARARDWLVANNSLVVAAVLALIGTKLLLG